MSKKISLIFTFLTVQLFANFATQADEEITELKLNRIYEEFNRTSVSNQKIENSAVVRPDTRSSKFKKFFSKHRMKIIIGTGIITAAVAAVVVLGSGLWKTNKFSFSIPIITGDRQANKARLYVAAEAILSDPRTGGDECRNLHKLFTDIIEEPTESNYSKLKDFIVRPVFEQRKNCLILLLTDYKKLESTNSADILMDMVKDALNPMQQNSLMIENYRTDAFKYRGTNPNGWMQSYYG